MKKISLSLLLSLFLLRGLADDGALTLQFSNSWIAQLRWQGGKPLNLNPYLAQGTVEFDLAVQFYVDDQKTPIEDASVEWKEADAPFVKVARLSISQQDLETPAGQKQEEYVEKLSFDPWHAPVEFKPLGNIMRARNAAYRVSTQTRSALPEPTQLETFE